MADAIQNAAVSSVWVKGEERNIKVLSNMMVDLNAVVDIDPEEVGVTEPPLGFHVIVQGFTVIVTVGLTSEVRDVYPSGL